VIPDGILDGHGSRRSNGNGLCVDAVDLLGQIHGPTAQLSQCDPGHELDDLAGPGP
jgi:hypothetical protein